MSVLSLRSRCEAAEAAGRDEAASALLTTVLTDELAAALGVDESLTGAALAWSAFVTGDPTDAGVEAAASGRTWSLTGTVGIVPGGVAESAGEREPLSSLLVVARSKPVGGRDRGIRIHRIDAAAPGLRIEPLVLVDGTLAHAVQLDGVEASDGDAVGPPRDATPALSDVFDLALVLATAEMLGAATAAMDDAVAWVSRREQFGSPLATRQVVQHRIADMAIACSAVRGLLDDAVARTEAGEPWRAEATAAKLLAARRLPDVTAGAHQLHGGEGYYADRPLHRRHKRVLVLAHLLGSPAAMRRRLAGLLAH